MIFKTNSAEETIELAKKLAEKYQDGAILALIGDLGAGKTTFVQGFAKSLGINNKILSPTFVLMRQYDLPGKKARLYHIDLYRLDEIKELDSLGLSEIFENPENIVLIEWAEKLGQLLPENAIKINFKRLSENSRQIEVKE